MNQGASPTASANAAVPQPKPIRFVTNHDGPYAKRRRINSACLTCRKKKTRCSGAPRHRQGLCCVLMPDQVNGRCAGHAPKTNTNAPAMETTTAQPTRKRMAKRHQKERAPCRLAHLPGSQSLPSTLSSHDRACHIPCLKTLTRVTSTSHQRPTSLPVALA